MAAVCEICLGKQETDDWDDDPDFDNEDEEFPGGCGMTPSGQCTMAGSEDCDWE